MAASLFTPPDRRRVHMRNPINKMQNSAYIVDSQVKSGEFVTNFDR
ncbi:hypothetical protein CO2235_170163 [Cupriavidus oxalaticus]|uniref:Uncharacterized protein n=1 Tax=Cupriavidus oxalaticus TaxID=96344 RepID=A0A375G0F1_9BURK|nr:hypothetical protein CO2235_170163 [Cupriavidus oxalaticus]